jgi:hypothetical protein
MNNEQKIMAEFAAFFQEGNKEAAAKVEKALNVNAVQKLVEATKKVKQYTIEDVTPQGYGL